MNLAIVGGRDFNDSALFAESVAPFMDKITTVVSGGASGADTMAKSFANDNLIPYVVFLPDWTKYGRAAGPMRNRQIVDASDALLAFWDGVSKGTKSSINYAKKRGIPVTIIRYGNNT